MKYGDYENYFVDMLKMDGVDVGLLPFIDKMNEARATTKPRVYIVFNGSQFAPREELAVTAQLESLQFEIFLRAKSRHGKLGIFALIDEIINRLLGITPPDAKGGITFVNLGYVNGIQNTWEYALTLTFDAYKVEPDRTIPGVNITKITHKINEDEKI